MYHRFFMTAIAIAAAPALVAAQSTGTAASASAAASASTTAGSQPTASSQTDAQGQATTPQARIDAAMHAAAKAGIPSSLLSSKVSEGQAKHVPPARIASAVEARLGSLTRASTALKSAGVSTSDASDLAVSADALEAGVSQSALVS